MCLVIREDKKEKRRAHRRHSSSSGSISESESGPQASFTVAQRTRYEEVTVKKKKRHSVSPSRDLVIIENDDDDDRFGYNPRASRHSVRSGRSSEGVSRVPRKVAVKRIQM